MGTRSRWLAGAAAISLTLATLIGGSPATAAERPDSLGKDFWITFPQNYVQTPQLTLFISSPSPTSGEVSIPGLAFSQPFTTTNGAVTSVSIPPEAQLNQGNSGDKQNLGIHVTSAAEVSVYGLNRIQYTTDAFLALPTDVLRSEYLVLGWQGPGGGGNGPSELAILATQDGTSVSYTPSANTTSGVTAGSTQTVTLNKGEALPVSSNAGDLSGTAVSSSAPVSVYGGHNCANIPTNSTSYCDHVVEQIPPTGTWGQSFLTAPLKTRKNGDTFRVLASADDTKVSVNGTEVATLNRGQFHQQIIDGSSVVSATKPVLLAQYSNGTTYDGVTSDPFMMLVTPAEQFLSQYTFATPATGFRANFVNVVTPTTEVGNVTLDGAAVPGGEFTPIPGTSFSSAQLDLTAGSHTMSSPNGFGIYVYGFDQDDSYGYPGGAAFAAINDLTALSITPPSQQVVVGNQACVTTTATDKNGQPLAGINVNLALSGVNSSSTTGLTDANGQTPFCYTSTAKGTDTITSSFGQLSASATVQWVQQGKAKPAKRKKLPIHAKKVKGQPVSLGARDSVVLVKSVKTNKHGKVSVRAFCTAAGTGAAGEVRFCRTSLSDNGTVTVHTTGFQTVKVTVIARATPKKGQRDTWRPNSWRKSWKVKP